MACGKPPDPNRTTARSPAGHPSETAVLSNLLDSVQAKAETLPPGEELDQALSRAELVLRAARAHCTDPQAIARLEARLDNIKGFTFGRLRDDIDGKNQPRKMGTKAPSAVRAGKQLSEKGVERKSKTLISALSKEDHWRATEVREQLVKCVERSGKIPDEYKKQLPTDVAEILKVCPGAAGITKALLLRGQATPLVSRSKLGSKGNTGVGTAYELMGSAALIRGASKSVNGGKSLCIDSSDQITFGVKSQINRQLNSEDQMEMPTRKTVEGDLHIGRKTADGWREIQVDFKHVKDAKGKSATADLRNQVENVVRALQQGQIDEYHFATNGRLRESFRQVINQANDVIDQTNAERAAEGGEQIERIAYHEHLTSLPKDPTT